MKPRIWKVMVLTLSLFILFTFGINETFHYYGQSFYTAPSGANGTVVVIGVGKNIEANGRIIINPVLANGSVEIAFQNGTKLTISSPLTLSFHFPARIPSGGASGTFGGAANLSLTSNSPIDAGIVQNVPPDTWMNRFSSYGQASYFNYYVFYVSSYATVQVNVVGGL